MGTELTVSDAAPFVGVLPEQVRTRDGAVFDPRLSRWVYRDGVFDASLNFDSLKVLSETLVHSLKSTLVWYAENRSARYVANLFTLAEHFARFLGSTTDAPVPSISSAELINYRSALGADSRQWYLAHLAGLLKKWHALGFVGVTDDANLFLNQVRLKGNRTGAAVLTMDSHDGPYTDIELNGIQAALNEAYAAGNVDLESYLLAWLFMLLGQRPVQYTALKVCDVGVGRTPEGDAVYSLRVPRAKQRQARLRSQFKERILIASIGELLVEYAGQIRSQFVGRLADPSQAPLFPARSVCQRSHGFEYHVTAEYLSKRVRKALYKLDVRSERTGERVHITPLRFRRTVGTRAAEEGFGELIIAELLDHTDTRNVGVYVQATPVIVERIDRAIAMQMAPLAQAFAGVLIRDESQATRGNDPSSRIVDLRIDRSVRPMGSCGQHDFCGLAAPIACYTCKNFQPWLDGPHEAVLGHLLAKREQLLTTTDARIASVNDRTILAVAEVIRRCDEVRHQSAGPLTTAVEGAHG
jgi:integrase